jgi:hypothetical protein
VQARFNRIRLVHSPIHDRTRQCADDDVSERLGLVLGADLATRHAVLDKLQERGVQREAALNAVARAGQHLADQLAVRIARLVQGRRDVVEQSDEAGGDRFVLAIEDDVVQVEQALVGERTHHVLAGREVVEERPVRDVGALADVLQLGRRDALLKEQIERRAKDPMAHFHLAPVHPVHGSSPGPQSFSESSQSANACAGSIA